MIPANNNSPHDPSNPYARMSQMFPNLSEDQGDIRSGSTKRVASAVGEGAMAVSQLHQVLAEQIQNV